MTERNSKTFSLMSLLLALTIVGLGLAYVAAKREAAKAAESLAEAQKLQDYLAGEAGYFEVEDESKIHIRELENTVPLARRFRVRFPHRYYNIVYGDWLGGEFKPENLKRRHQSKASLGTAMRMSIHVFNNPSNEAQYSFDRISFNSGTAGGGYLPDYQIDVGKLNYSDDQQGQAAEWQIINERPHGPLQVYDADEKFIPLFILKDHIKAKDESGNFQPVKGLAFWIEPVSLSQTPK